MGPIQRNLCWAVDILWDGREGVGWSNCGIGAYSELTDLDDAECARGATAKSVDKIGSVPMDNGHVSGGLFWSLVDMTTKLSLTAIFVGFLLL